MALPPYGEPKDSGSVPDSDSGFSSSGEGDNCPLFDWVFTSSNTNDWVEFSDRHIELRIQTSGDSSGEPGDCGGSNALVQSGSAEVTVIVPPGKVMTFDWILTATVEAQDAGFDYGEYRVNGVQIALVPSQGEEDGCIPVTPPPQAGTTVLNAGTHTLRIYYDTVDALYHTAESGVEFEITSCHVMDA